jgi:uncharacterized membrane protein YfcA
MPILGVVAACLANAVPIGGGIVYVPALSLLGTGMKLGVSFSVATMTVGNGIFGYLNWQRKNPSLLVWEVIQYTVLPSWFGTVVSLIFVSPSEVMIRTGFALFCFLLALFCFLSVHKGGIEVVVRYLKNLFSAETTLVFTNCNTKNSNSRAELLSNWGAWLPLVLISFFAGLVLVPNIAIGPSLTTFLGLVLLGFKEEEAMVTGIVVGGWASIIPFLIHIFWYEDVPWDKWLMVLPGVALGAWLAPKVKTFIGIENSLMIFGIFLLCTFVLFMTH